MPSSAVFHKYGAGQLHSGSKSGPVVKNQKQAIAIYLSEKRKEQANGGKYPEKKDGGSIATALNVAHRLKRAAGGYNWQTRAEAMGLARSHVGPIMSAVPGRTDRHNINVPSGSYVLPADHVSSLGQGNTMAGVKVLNNMFSKGPYGTGGAGMTHGAGPPKPPGMMRTPMAPKGLGLMGSDSGGARGEGESGGVPVVVAGGEYVIPPNIVAQIGDGDLKKGHAALDAWVINHRKKHVKTLQKLPGPAKS